MSRSSFRTALALACGALVSHLLMPVASAGPLAVMSHVVSTSAQTASGPWSSERMRAAVPMEQLVADMIGTSGAVTGEVARGVPRTIAATSRAGGLIPLPGGSSGMTGAEWDNGGAVVSTAGRVFFTFAGRDASCSGNAVTSANGSTVLTAAHCVKMGRSWHSDWVFVPGYNDGDAPFGEWPATSMHVTPQWDIAEDISHDVGAVTVAELDGRRLTDVVGGQGVAFNQQRGQEMYAFGYPAQAPYDGSELIYCSGSTFDDFLFTVGTGMSCDMTGGSSGGPWFLAFDEATGTGIQNSVNSFGYIFLPGVMFGPYFGDSAEAVYDEAQTS